LEKELQALGVHTYSLGMKNRLYLPKHHAILRSIVAEWRPVLYWGWMYHGALISCFAARIRAAPILWNIRQTVYDVHHEKRGTQYVMHALKWFKNIPVGTVYNSSISQQQHRDFGFTGTAHVIPNGFSDEVFYPAPALRKRVREQFEIPPQARVIGHAARFHPMKDHARFFECVISLLHELPDLYVVCCGAGVDSTCLPQGFPTERVRFCGIVQDMNGFYNAIDVLCVSSSHGEAFPNVIAEAMLVGVHCVVTDVGSASDIVGALGTVVPRSNSDALRAGLRSALAEDSLRTEEARLNTRSVIQKQYALPSVQQQYAALEAATLRH
jgi:glycosyltransferase involved in cell wall biosynthesis